MKRLTFLFFLFVISLPTATLAASCRCNTPTTKPPFTCETDKLFLKWTPDSCAAYVGQHYGVNYTNCTFCYDDTCGAGCPDTAGMTKTDKVCTSDSQCTQVSGNTKCGGVGFCYMDAAAISAYQNSDTMFTTFSPLDLRKPQLEINIPGVSFTDVKNTLETVGDTQYIHVPFLAEYLSAIYKFGIIIASIAAAIMIIVNGFRITVSAGGEERANGIRHITQALTGLVLIWGTYAILYTINPDLTQFRPLRIQYVTLPPMEEEEDVTTGQAADLSTIQPVSGLYLTSARGAQISNLILPDLQAAAQDANAADKIQLYVADGFRSIEDQKAAITKNCQNSPGADKCNPKPNRPDTCILKGLDPSNCPHTTGKAVDVWGMIKGKQCITQDKCKRDPNTDPCHNDPCQKSVIDAMKQNNFCNSRTEAWHFEHNPPMSGNCNY